MNPYHCFLFRTTHNNTETEELTEFPQSGIKLILSENFPQRRQSTRGPRLSTKAFPRHFLNLTVHQPTPTKEVSVIRSVSLMSWRRNKSDPERRRAQGSPVGGYSCFNGRVDKKMSFLFYFFIIRDISLECQTSKVRRNMFKVDRNINYLQKPH